MTEKRGGYEAAGVSIERGERAVDLMRSAVEGTHGPEVIGAPGGFAGIYALAGYKAPILSSTIDGVGTKVLVAREVGRYDSLGTDIVNHCVNDVLVQAATPLFFLDYIAASSIDALTIAEVVTGMAEACAASGCALLGGETAEMPGVYAPGAFDIAGTLIDVVERSAMLPRGDVAAGDVLVGVASSGPHTNGYSLLRRVFEWMPMDATPAGFDVALGEALLEPHRSYLGPLGAVVTGGAVKALAHITGGGLSNLLRLNATVGFAVDRPLAVPPVFGLIASRGGVPDAEMHDVFNMGCGFVAVVPEAQAGEGAALLAGHHPGAARIGTVTDRAGRLEI